MYLWTMSALHSLGWAIVLCYAVCCALRLARFNTQIGTEPAPHMTGFFTGVPAPGGAGLAIMPLFASFEWGDWIARSPYLNAAWLALVAFLMVSRLPTLSLKHFHVPHRFVMPALLGVGLVAAFATTAPWPTLFVVGVLYIGSIPVTIAAAARLKRSAGAARRPEAADAAAPALLAAPPPASSLGEVTAPRNEWRH
jgi:CDP-diacylglycerol--serine O-phosphatidyltransferase